MGSLVPGHQGTGVLGPGPREFFYFIFYFFGGSSFLKKMEKNCFLSVFPFFLSLFLSFSVHTLWVLLSLMNFTKVSCEGKLKKGVTYKLQEHTSVLTLNRSSRFE